MKILVLGSEGFIGQHVVNFYLSQNQDVYGCDLFEASVTAYTYFKTSLLSNDIDLIFDGNQFDFCINAAGSGNVGYSISQPISDFEANVSSVSNILDVIRKHCPSCKYLHISSAAVYGNPQELPIKEESTTTNPLSPYGWHKLMSEMVCKEYSSIYGIRTAIVRPFSVYGPGLKKQIFWDLFQKTKTADTFIEIWGTGNESRDFIYIDDLTYALDQIVKNGSFTAEIYNVGTGIESTISKTAARLVQSLDKQLEIKFNQQSRIGDPINWRADISKLKSVGFEYTITVDEGISKLAKWLKSIE